MASNSALPGDTWLWAVWMAATDAMALSDADGRVIAANPAYETLYGYTLDEVIGNTFSIIFPEAERQDAEEQYRAVFATTEPQAPFESLIRRRDGTLRTVESRISFVEQDNRRIAMLSIIRDITNEVAARHTAASVDQGRRELLSSISHDIKSPLSVIKGHAQRLRRRATRGSIGSSEQLISALEQIETSALQVASLVDDLVAVSDQGNSTPPALQVKPVDLVALAREAVDRHRDLSDQRDLRLESEVESVIGNWDGARLRRVLDNLLGNALKYSPDGGLVSLRLSLGLPGGLDPALQVSMPVPPGSGVWLAVTDRGIGICPADLPHVFERFWRGSRVANSVPGAGIGLSSVRQIVEQHGGQVQISSREGHGTMVTVWLPLDPGLPRADTDRGADA